MSATAEEALAGVRIVKSFAREPYEVGRYSDGVERLFRIAIKRVRLSAILGPIIGLLAFSTIAIVLWVGSREVIGGRLTPGKLVSFLIYTMMVASPIAAFTGLYSQFQRALGASERVFQLLDTPPEMQDAADAIDLPPIRGEVRFEERLLRLRRYRSKRGWCCKISTWPPSRARWWRWWGPAAPARPRWST